jgi:hypothetical protein
LQSVLAAPVRDPYGKGFVNFVDSRWKPMGSERYGEVEDEEKLDLIDGYTEENIGWMKIASVMIDTELYDAAFTFPGGG